MINECVHEHHPFGVVLLQSGSEVKGLSPAEPTAYSINYILGSQVHKLFKAQSAMQVWTIW